jgi:hypothetical protein
MDLFVSRRRDRWQARFGARVFQCAVGRSGVAMNKREGDGATPIGCFTMRYLLFRPDRREAPDTAGLPVRALAPQLAWCDDPNDRAYNQAVNVPYPAHTESMWREDVLYVSGELDRGTAGLLATACRGSVGIVTIDLAEATFFDAGAHRAVTKIAKSCKRVRLRHAPPIVQRVVFALAG